MSELDVATAELSMQLATNDNKPIDPRDLPVRFSRLKLFALSAAHYYDACQRDDGDDSLEFRLGSGVHAIVLGTPVIRFSGRRAGKIWDAFALEHSDKTILNDREWHEATAMASAIMRRKEAMAILFDDALVETRIDWSFLGRACRSTPDSRSTHAVAELKTARISKPSWFVRDGLRLHYPAQLAMYLDAIEHATSKRPYKAYIVAVEKSRPHPVVIFRLTDRALEYGAKMNRIWFEQLLGCERSGHWPEYSESILDFDLPDPDALTEIEIDGKLVEL